MAPTRIAVDATKALSHLRQLNAAAARAGATVVRVGSPLRYAYGIEFGRHRGGRLARRAGGAFYLHSALLGVKRSARRGIASALPQGPAAVSKALLRVGYNVEREAKLRVPVATGTLRRSIHTVASER